MPAVELCVLMRQRGFDLRPQGIIRKTFLGAFLATTQWDWHLRSQLQQSGASCGCKEG